MTDPTTAPGQIPNALFRGLGAPPSPPAAPATPPRHRMHLNESPYPPAPGVIAAMRAACAHVNTYPDPNWRDLTNAIAAQTGVDAGRIVFGNGSDELIVSAGKLALDPEAEMVVPVPSFPGYARSAALAGARVVGVPVRADGAADVAAMAAAITPRTRLVYCATPNNPTGGLSSADDLALLSAAVPEGALFIVDEAYYEFARHAGGVDHLPLLRARRGPWVSLRTFSKAFGLAGIRVGYALCGSDALADAFQNARSVFNVNAVAQAGARAALDDLDHMRWILDQTARERDRLHDGLIALGARPFPSVANFVTAAIDRPAAEVVAALATRGILISRLMQPGYENYLRITVGTADATDAFLAALTEILAPPAAS